jgi:hypothetical protein
VSQLDGLPDMLTIAEAARLARISARVYYAEAREFLESQGERGLPVVELGRRPVLRVPKARLADRLGITCTEAAGEDTAVVVPLDQGRDRGTG